MWYINCTSVNDSTVSHSSMEAEIKASDLYILEMIHTRHLLELLGSRPSDNMIFCNNMSAIELCRTLKITTYKTKYIQMRINFIREYINAPLVEIMFVPSEYNVADVLTKPLAHKPFNIHADKLLEGFGGDILHILSERVSMNYVMASILFSKVLTLMSRYKVYLITQMYILYSYHMCMNMLIKVSYRRFSMFFTHRVFIEFRKSSLTLPQAMIAIHIMIYI
jgi:hypothetical protein